MKTLHKRKVYTLGILCDYLLTMEKGEAKIQQDVFLGIEKGKLTCIEPFRKRTSKMAQTFSKTFLHAKNQLVMPGLINTHTHLAMSLFRGIDDDLSFHDWLFHRILPLEVKVVNPDFVSTGTMLSAMECMRFGTTTVNDQYFFSKISAKIWDEVGLRGVFSQVLTKHPTPEDFLLGRDKESLFQNLYHSYMDHPRIRTAIGPHAPYSCNDPELQLAARISDQFQVPLHIHVSETKPEVEAHYKEYQMSPVERLDKLGALHTRTLCAHAIHLNEKDRELIRDRRAKIAHNPDSNLKLGSGLAPIADYLSRGIVVGLGTDGAASNNNLNLFSAMNLATKLQKLQIADSLVSHFGAAEALRTATWNGAHCLGLEKEVGSLEVGKRADMILLDLEHPHLYPRYDLLSHLVYALCGTEVSTLICDGKVLMKNRKFKTIQEDKWLKKIGSHQKRIQKEIELLRHEYGL